MAAPTKSAAPTAESKHTRVTTPLIDYSALSVADAEPVTYSRSSILDETPFERWVRDSLESKTAKAITIPDTAVAQTKTLLQLARQKVGCGVKVNTTPVGKGQTTVTFQAGPKRAYNGRKSSK